MAWCGIVNFGGVLTVTESTENYPCSFYQEFMQCRCVFFCSLANFACMEGHIYCKPHFMEIFMTKGEQRRQREFCCTAHVSRDHQPFLWFSVISDHVAHVIDVRIQGRNHRGGQGGRVPRAPYHVPPT